MSQVVDFVTCCLITYGFAFAVALTDGPFGWFSSFRSLVKSKTKREWLQDGVSCPVCTSFYIGAIVALFFASSVSEWAVLWLTAFGFACWVTAWSPE